MKVMVIMKATRDSEAGKLPSSAWAKKIPNPHGEHPEVELRRVFTAEDFGENFTPELRAAEERLEQQLRERK